jgi:predicted kinase
MEIITRFFQDTKQSFFLFGPRGTGKSTWVHKNLKNALFIDLLAPEVFRRDCVKFPKHKNQAAQLL